MLFDNKEIDKLRKENSERGGDRRPKVPAGEQLLAFKDAKIDYAKSDKAPMVVAEFEKDDQHKPITRYWKLSGKGSDSARSQIIDFLERGFNYILQACESEEDLIRQLKQFFGKKVKAAVQHRMEVYQKDGKTYVYSKPEIWYFGNSSDASFTMDPAKRVKLLDAKEMEKLNEVKRFAGEIRVDDDVKQYIGNLESTASVRPVVPFPAEDSQPKKETEPVIVSDPDLPF